jgi:hypothetical protein
MKTATRGTWIALTLTVICLVGFPASGSQEYIIEGISPPSGLRFGWSFGFAPRFTHSGRILGTLSGTSEYDSFLWEPTDGFQIFDRFPEGGQIRIDSVNASGLGVGAYRSPSSNGTYWSTLGIQPIFYKPTQGYIDIGLYPLQSDIYSVKSTHLFDITADGVAVGTYFYSGQFVQSSGAFQWSEENGFQALPMTSATKINSVGAILDGFGKGIQLTDGTYHAITFGDPQNQGISQLADLNDSSTVVGWGKPANNSNYLPYAWDPDSGVRVLGTPQNSLHHYPFAVNASGLVAGYSELPIDGQSFIYGEQAVIWNSDGQHFRLNDLAFPGWDLGRATDIDDDGRILGLGALNGELAMFILTPVPEPGVINIAAFLSLGWMLYWRQYRRSWPKRKSASALL